MLIGTPAFAHVHFKDALSKKTKVKVAVTLDGGKSQEMIVSNYPINAAKSFEVIFLHGASTANVRLTMTSLPSHTRLNLFEAIQSVEVFEIAG